jgi:glycosyltransferase involved in cell wall biosynthesis
MLTNLRDYFAIKHSGLFDERYYLLHNPDVRRADIDPLKHFVKFGWKEGRNPSEEFHTYYYLNTYPDVKNAGINPLFHYIRHEKREGRKTNPNEAPSPQKNLQKSSTKGIQALQKIKLQIFHTLLPYYKKLPPSVKLKIKKRITYRPTIVAGTQISKEDIYDNFLNPERKENIMRFFSFLDNQSKDIKNIQYIFFLPLFSTGGAELVALNFIRLILEKKKEISILLVVTDANKLEVTSSFPSRLASLNLEQFLGSQELIKKQIFVYDLIQTLRPSVLHNINSSVFWLLLLEKGEKLRKISKIFADIFCVQYDLNNNRTGYAEHYLKNGIPFLDGLLSDNASFLDEAINLYGLQAYRDKMFTVYNPIDELREVEDDHIEVLAKEKVSSKTRNTDRLQVIWAARLDEQKRWKFFLEIVRNCDFCDFDMYGQAVIDESPHIISLPNLTYKGGFTSINKILEMKHYDAYLFTSRYEGLPNTLLSVGLKNIPIIAPSIGGIKELVTEKTGYLLIENPTIDDYIKALHEIKDNPNEAKIKALEMRKLILERHNWEKFSDVVSKIPGYL